MITPRVQLAVLGARDTSAKAVRSVRAGSERKPVADDGAAILFVDARMLREHPDTDSALASLLRGKLAMIVHSSTDKVGSLGETRLVVIEGDKIVRSAAIGTDEAMAALARAAKRAASRDRRRNNTELEEDDEI